MTKQNMITEIQAKEAALWLAMAEYDHKNAPIECTREEQIRWDCTDEGHLKRLWAWNSVSELMDSMGIKEDYDNFDRKIAHELNSDLFRRRQAARGIFYN